MHSIRMKSPSMKFVVCAAFMVLAASCSGDSTDEGTDSPLTTSGADTPATTVASTTSAAQSESTSVEPDADVSFEGELAGLFTIELASCEAGNVAGSYFRMIQPGGDLADGPFVPNADSSCEDSTFTPLMPGTDGGLVTLEYQPAPDPPFDDAGNGLSNSVVEPATFFAVAFSIATEDGGKPPTITATDGVLTGDLSAWTAYYGNLTFLQGSPQPNGSLPGLSSAVAGTIDAATGAYTLEWSSQILGGSFNDFTGVWHLEGTFQPSS